MGKKLLFAVGGTGGHLFPAQALARELREEHPELEILFAGGKLGSNPFFDKFHFPFREIASSSPRRSKSLRSLFQIGRGVGQGFSLIKEFDPDLVVGFGSFYSFPLLACARLKKIPYFLVEPNALPGQVNRLFSTKADLCALQFSPAAEYMRGKTAVVKLPQWSRKSEEVDLDPREARKYFRLAPDRLTLLVFGGSQGARVINEAVVKVDIQEPFQVIHLCGIDEDVSAIEAAWKARDIRACVKPFEQRMQWAFRAADGVVCRSGAATCSELIAFALPALLIPWPGASDQHQQKNAQYLAQRGAAHLLEQAALGELSAALQRLLSERYALQSQLVAMREEDGAEKLSTLVMRQMR